MRIALVAGLAYACAATEDTQKSRASRSIVADVILTVDNRTSRAVVIYLEADTLHDSLGVVPRRASRSFALPSAAGDSTSALRLEARDRRDTPGIRSDVFRAAPGHQVVWTLDRTSAGALTMR